jgi:processive 1,2-diacylglycerol beta-glucosyltransferase
LEEEYTEDQDYYLNQATLDNFESEGIDPDLLEILKRALGDREEMEIVWSRE